MPQTGWDWTGLITWVLTCAQLPSLLVALCWGTGWRRVWWGNAALIVLALLLGLVSSLPGGIIAGFVWPTVLVNLPGVLVGLWGRGASGVGREFGS